MTPLFPFNLILKLSRPSKIPGLKIKKILRGFNPRKCKKNTQKIPSWIWKDDFKFPSAKKWGRKKAHFFRDSEILHPGRLTAGTYKSPLFSKENDLPNLHDYVPAVHLQGRTTPSSNRFLNGN